MFLTLQIKNNTTAQRYATTAKNYFKIGVYVRTQDQDYYRQSLNRKYVGYPTEISRNYK